MRGYQVVTSDRRVVGHVTDVREGFLIVESGRLRRFRRPVPREFTHVVDEAAQVFVTVPRRVLRDAPEVDRRGAFDVAEASRLFGLAAAGDRGGEHRRVEIRKRLRPGPSPAQDGHHRSPALLGDRHWAGIRVGLD
jgi:hypothetical protein